MPTRAKSKVKPQPVRKQTQPTKKVKEAPKNVPQKKRVTPKPVKKLPEKPAKKTPAKSKPVKEEKPKKPARNLNKTPAIEPQPVVVVAEPEPVPVIPKAPTQEEINQKWIRNKSDEIAVAEGGCWFDEERAKHACTFIESNLCLYEGEKAGEPFMLLPWQRDLVSRVFGWVRFSNQFNRAIRRFRKASIWVPKKNGKTPLAAAVGLYLFSADGEQGQKVFSAAKDGKQANIMHTHARKMVEKSPLLSRMCNINRSSGLITHRPTSSLYQILSGDNIQGQEGLNGSVVIDETHVVDERLANALEYMGISRSEPLQFEVSTVGDNPLGYGYRQWEYGRQVESGERRDDGFFYVFYGSKQDATDEELLDESTWPTSNPSWGHTVYEEEFRESLIRARRSLHDWTIFKKYRFNIWQTAETPWLNFDEWKRCERAISEEDFLGQYCVAGLDLARTKDSTALVLIFRTEDVIIKDEATGQPRGQATYAVLPYFFLPEETAKLGVGNVPFMDWVRRGHVIATPGNVCDYGFVHNKFMELSSKFQIQSVTYDPNLANELTQDMSEGRFVGDQEVLKGTGIERIAFGQTANNYTGPANEFERLVMSNCLRHPGNLMLNWQASHVAVKTDSYGHKRPIKQREGDYRTIDGIAAIIMALSAARCLDNGGSIYDIPGNVAC